jgi:GntR family transcriptional regulator
MLPDPKLLFRIDRQSKMPLYNLIDQNFRELILSGQLKPGDAIPSEWDLATVYGVSRLTVRHALDNLACQGWLSRRHGVGTFIANPTITPIAPSNLSFSEQMRAVGRRPSSRLVSIQVIPAGCEVAGHLRLQESEPVVEITRLRLADDEPILIETSYLSRSRFPGLENATELASGSLNGYLVTHYQVHVVEMD